jgi:arylsulfatase A-like enzyme
VPVVLDGVDTVGERCSLLDIAPTLVASQDIDVPADWQGTDLATDTTDQTLTVAPWHDRATVCWQDFERKLIARDADVSMTEGDEEVGVERADVPEDVERQLQNLGYSDAG